MVIRVQMGRRRNRSVTGAVLAGVICTGLSVLGYFVVVFGARLSGGIPFMPDGLNQAIGRFFIVLGAIVTSGMAGYAFYDAWRLHRELKLRRQKSS